MPYLLKDGAEGYKEMPGEPFSKEQQFRPWALTPDGRVVYSEWKPQPGGMQGIMELVLGKMHGKAALRSYDQTTSQMRRREFETAMAKDAAGHPECSMTAVNLVSDGLRAYLKEREGTHSRENIAKEADDCVKARCYNDTGSGRLGTTGDAAKLSSGEGLQHALEVLQGNDIAKILGIQVAFANTLSKKLGYEDNQGKRHKQAAIQVAPSQGFLYSWFDSTQGTPEDNLRRGREKMPTGAVATTAQGLMPGDASDGGELRKRGIDEWRQNSKGSNFLKGLDDRNLIFGAGRSGTTGELLKTYRAFGGTDSGESFKQYLLAIVVYLVGGGHHTCHEIFSVANLMVGSNGPQGSRQPASVQTLVADAYVPGKYLKHLPESYTSTGHFKALAQKYYDIAYMGHLHGTFRG